MKFFKINGVAGVQLFVRSVSILTFLMVAGCGTAPAKTNQALSESTKNTSEPVEMRSEPTPHPYYNGRRASASREHKQLFSRARDYMAKENWANAAQILLVITEANPKLSGAWLNLGITFEQQDLSEKAQEAFENAIKANNNNIAAYNQLAVNLREQGKFDESLAIYKKAIDVWEFDVDTHKNLGILYDLYLGEWPAALRHYQTAQQLLAEPDRMLKGWIIDLERRIAAQVAR